MSEADQRRRIAIMGAGREGRKTAESCTVLGIEVAGFLDDTRPRGERVNGVPVLGGFDLIEDIDLVKSFEWVVALGLNEVRAGLYSKIRDRGGQVATLIHPTCQISPTAKIGEGVRIETYSCVLPNSSIGDYALLERFASVGLDVVIGEGAFIGPGCQIAGGCRIGRFAFMGIGSSMVEDTSVGDYSVIGAGAAVATKIPDHVLAVGVPAKVKKSLMNQE